MKEKERGRRRKRSTGPDAIPRKESSSTAAAPPPLTALPPTPTLPLAVGGWARRGTRLCALSVPTPLVALGHRLLKERVLWAASPLCAHALFNGLVVFVSD